MNNRQSKSFRISAALRGNVTGPSDVIPFETHGYFEEFIDARHAPVSWHTVPRQVRPSPGQRWHDNNYAVGAGATAQGLQTSSSNNQIWHAGNLHGASYLRQRNAKIERTKHMNKHRILKLIGELAAASVNHYKTINENTRRSPVRAADRELKAAQSIARATCMEPVTDEELQSALGW
jgi:hypothetical protein